MRINPDVTIIGSGPAGLSAAINCAAEGLKVLIVEKSRTGGQAYWSNRIENVLGFPSGITGAALAKLGKRQASKFGVQFTKNECIGIQKTDTCILTLKDGHKVNCKAIIIACGLQFRPFHDLTQPNPKEIRRYRGKRIAIIGAGNSAAQAAEAFVENKASVSLFSRSNIVESMSAYLYNRLSERIQSFVNPHIHVEKREKGYSINGEPFDDAFAFIGSIPSNSFGLLTNKDGYICTDANFKTSIDGVFAIGDCRANSVKRVSVALGEGAEVTPQVFCYVKGGKSC